MRNKAHAWMTILSLLLGLSLVLTGCLPGGQDSGNATPTAVSGGTPTAGGGTPAAGKTATPKAGSGKMYIVGILQQLTHPALDFTAAGVKAAFADQGMKEGTDVKFDLRNAENDAPTARSIANKFVSDKVDVIVAIGTLAAQQAQAATADTKTTPVVFAAVTDPYIAGLAGTKTGDTITSDPAVHPDNLTGVQAFPPVQSGLKLIQEVLPNAKRIGLLWNPGEPNSLASTLEVRKVSADLGLTVIEAPVASAAASAAAAAGFANKGIDAFFVSTSNTVVAGLDAIVSEARRTQKPLFGNDPLSASRGAVAADGLDYTENGHQAGDMAYRIVTGKATVKSMSIERTTKEAICVNTAAAADQGVTLPQSLLDRAKGCTYNKITSPVPPTAGAAGTPAPTPAAGSTPAAGTTPAAGATTTP